MQTRYPGFTLQPDASGYYKVIVDLPARVPPITST